MGRIALIVVATYLVILLALTAPLALAALGPELDVKALGGLMSGWRYWAWLLAGLVGEAVLLLVPVRVASRRPVTRRSLVWPVAAAGFLVAGLLAGAICAVDELVRKDEAIKSVWPILIAGGLLWIGWTVLFYVFSREREPRHLLTRQCRYLLAGSMLELLVAVPAHIVARSRSTCCAGYMTFTGIAFGIAVMLFSFGPGVFFLYADRWNRLHPKQSISDT